MSNQVYSNSTTQYPIIVDTIQSDNINTVNLITQNLEANDFLYHNPQVNNASNDFLVVDLVTHEVGYNNSYFDQAVKTTSSPTFTNILTLTETTGNTMRLTTSSVLGAISYSNGTNFSVLEFPPTLTANRTAILPDADGNIILDSASQTISNKIYSSDSNFNTAFGTDALNLTTTGTRNTAIGSESLTLNTTGDYNVAIGRNTMPVNTTGNQNVAVGADAMVANTTGFGDVGVGAFALSANTTGTGNTAVGYISMESATTSTDNCAFGNASLALNIIGGGNVAIGSNCLLNSLTDNNTAVGFNCLRDLTSGLDNIGIGNASGGGLSTGSHNIYIGPVTGVLSTEANTYRMGNTGSSITSNFQEGIFGITVGGTGIPVVVDNTGQLGTVVSSKRFKENIKDLDTKDILQRLRPVSFNYISDGKGGKGNKSYGLIAEEVAHVFPEMVVYDNEKKAMTLHYEYLLPILLKEVQELQKIILEMKNKQ